MKQTTTGIPIHFQFSVHNVVILPRDITNFELVTGQSCHTRIPRGGEPVRGSNRKIAAKITRQMFISKLFILFMLDNHIFDDANCVKWGAGKRPESRQISTANPGVRVGLGALEYSGALLPMERMTASRC
jgi:hypothetical protein